ncbi:MAG TPA: hemolysin family protein [Anaeromyxobacteraceae bacterium]|nr:hemolysin family protein [Anaeromyxobacteraceae bacterium]
MAIILGLILANGVFAGAEIAVIAVRRTRLQQLVDEGRGAARAVLGLRDDPERFLATVQVGITVVGATAAAFGGATLAEGLGKWIARVPVLQPYAPELAIALVIAVVSFLQLVVGELVPKSIALRSAERYALAVARPLLALAWVARPLIWVLTKTSNLFLAPFGDRTTFSESRLSVDELAQMVQDAARAGALDANSGEIAGRALEFGELTAADVMVPRNRIDAIRRDASEDELRRLVLEEGHARMPVYDGTLDNIVGYVVAKDLLGLAWERGLLVLEDVIRPPYFVPESAMAVEVLREMQKRHTKLALIVDEHGGVSGLVTLEDLVEELVGDIVGEGDSTEPIIRREPDGSAVVRGDAPIREVNRALDLDLEEGEGFTTVAGLSIALAGGIPAKGAQLKTEDGTALDVLDASPRVVRMLRVTPPPRTPPEDE